MNKLRNYYLIKTNVYSSKFYYINIIYKKFNTLLYKVNCLTHYLLLVLRIHYL